MRCEGARLQLKTSCCLFILEMWLKVFEGACKMYNHWKKTLLALTAFFWNACDNNTTPTGPVVGPDPTSSSTEGQNSSSSAVNPGSSSVDNPASSSSVVSSSSAQSSSSDAQLSSSAESSSSVESSSSSPIAESSSGGIEVVPLYGVYMDKETCTAHKDDKVYECTDGVTCVESDVEETPATSDPTEVTAKYGVVYKPEVTAKYGVVYIKDKVYTCSDGKVYNEAEFQAHYNTLIIDETVVLYGPPCAFDGSCGKDK